MILVNYHPTWMNWPVTNGVPVYRRRLVSPTKFLGGGLEPVELNPEEILGVELYQHNGNIAVTMTDGRRFWAEVDTWAVECYSGNGYLLETLRGKLRKVRYDEWIADSSS